MGKRNKIAIPARRRRELKTSPGKRVSIERTGGHVVIETLCGATKGLGKLREKMHRDDEER